MRDYELIYYVKSDIYIYASVRVDDGRLEFSTGLKAIDGKMDGLDRNVQRKLDRAKIDFEKHVGNCEKSNDPILKADCKEIIRTSIGGRRVYKKVMNIDELVTKYIKGAEDGTILNDKEKRYPATSIHLMRHAKRAAKIGGIDKVYVNELQPKHFQQLRARLTKENVKSYTKNKNGAQKGLSANTIETYNNVLVLMVNRARGLGWHNNNLDIHEKGIRAKGEDVDYAISYNESELQQLYNTKFDKLRMEEARDVFIFGCYTCLRHSDYFLTNYSMSLLNGNILHLRSLKTDNFLYIPLHPVAAVIYNKYKGNIPKIPYSKLNRICKEITEIAGFDSPCLFSRMQGGKKAEEHMPKWKMTTPHTMRRSFATNAFISGMPERMIMKIGGWKTYAAFERYLRLSGLDIAKLAMDQPFYKDWVWNAELGTNQWLKKK